MEEEYYNDGYQIYKMYNPALPAVFFDDNVNDLIKLVKEQLVYKPIKVIVSGPCTIVFFEDGKKEIVRMSKNEKIDDREKAFAIAICKHMFGSDFKKIFKMI